MESTAITKAEVDVMEKVMDFFTGKKDNRPEEVKQAAKSAASMLRLDAEEVKDQVQIDAEEAREVIRRDAQAAREEVRIEVEQAKIEINEMTERARRCIRGDADKVNEDAINATTTIRTAMKTLRAMIVVADDAMEHEKPEEE